MSIHPPSHAKFGTLHRVYAFAMAIGCALLLVGWGSLSQPSPLWIGAVAACGALCLRWPAAWPLFAIGLLPVADRTPVTGNGFITESIAIASAAMLALALRIAIPTAARLAVPAQDPQRALRWGGPAALLVGLLGVAYAQSTLDGLLPWPPPDANRFVLYGSHFDALRVGGAALSAFACLPLIAWPGHGLRQLPLAGVLSLLGIGLSVLVERLGFTGLMDFSSDYRVTGPFWEMHVGGAALDGALALCFPFALWLAFTAHGWLRAFALTSAVLGLYALLVGFTRSTYLALLLETLVLAPLWWRHGRRGGSATGHWSADAAAYLAIALLAMLVCFPLAGYRGLAALMAVTLAGWLLAGAAGGLKGLPYTVSGVVVGALLGAVGHLLSEAFGKLAYAQVAFAGLIALACCLPALQADEQAPTRRLISATALAWLLFAAADSASYWGGRAALLPMGLSVTLLGLLAAALSLRARPAWRTDASSIAPIVVLLGCAGLCVGVFANSYVQIRFSTLAEDWHRRLLHWQHGTGLLSSPRDYALGIGSGRFPQEFRWHAPDAAMPGDFRLYAENGDDFLALAGPNHMLGWGEIFRLTQRLPSAGLALPAKLSLRARARADGELHVEVCARHLIYASYCATRGLGVKGDQQWHALTWEFDRPRFDPPSWNAWRPLVFAMGVGSRNVRIDVAQVSLRDANGTELIANGDFSQGARRWFPTSDRNHLPWHAKSLFLHQWIEGGIVGLGALGFALSGALVRLFRHRASNPLAPPLLAALLGFGVIGLFDSVIDAPRVAFLFFLLLGAALGLRSGTRHASPQKASV